MRTALALVAACLVVALPAAAATKQYSSGRLALPIAAGTTAEHTIRVRDSGPVSHVAVWVRLTDSRVGDLTLSVRAPDGTTVVLAQHRGGEGKGFGTGAGCSGQLAVFDDVDSEPIASAPSPFVESSYRPEERLGALNGKQARGPWALRVAADGSGSTGTLECWQLDLSRNVVERLRSTARGVTATLSFREQSYVYRDVRIKIVRRGRTLLDARPARPVGPGWRPVDVRTIDLDGDREPEVVADYYSGGAHCCTISEIYRLTRRGYVETPRFWADPGYRIRGVDADPRPELVTADGRFFYTFTAYAFSRAPIVILHFDHGRFRDVTRRFPGAVARDAARALAEYRALRGNDVDARGIVAAYVADECLLRRCERGWRLVDEALRRGYLTPSFPTGTPAGRACVRNLRAFLRKTGYLR